MAFYHHSLNYPNENFYYTQIPYENGYNNYSSHSYYPPPQSAANFYSYEFLPTQSLIAYNNPGSIQYAVHHSVAAPSLPDEDLEFPEYDLTPFGGGYDIAQTYGKPLPPSDEICYPPSSISHNLPSAALVPVKEVEITQEEELPSKKEAENLEIEPQFTEEEDADDDDDGGGDDDGDDGGGDDDDAQEEDRSVAYEGVEENKYGREINQIPHGYGLEAFDLCENLFGYWPCLSKMNKKCGACGNEINGVLGGRGDEVDEWKRTADYLFGNPDPYGAWTDQCGHPRGYPVYGYDQIQYQYHPQASNVVYEQADQYGQNSWFP